MIRYIVCTTIALFFCIPAQNWTVADSTSGVNRFQPMKPDLPSVVPAEANHLNITCLRPISDAYEGIDARLTQHNFDTIVKRQVIEHTKEFYGLDNFNEIYVTFTGDDTTFILIVRESHICALPDTTSTDPIYLCLASLKNDACTIYDQSIVHVLVERRTNFAISGMSSSETLGTEWQPKYTTYFVNNLNENSVNKNNGEIEDIASKTMKNCQDRGDTYFLDTKKIKHGDLDKDSDNVVADNDSKDNHTGDDKIEDVDNIYKECIKTDEYHGSISTTTLLGYTLVVLSLLSMVNNLESSEILL